MKRHLYTTLIALGIASLAMAKENVNVQRSANPANNSTSGSSRVFAGCAPSKSRADLDINNVRTPVWINGDMWWDLVGNAQYEIPVGSGKNSLFSGAIWIGGKDNGSGNLKVAAQTYRQSGSDFWPGPIDPTTTTTSAPVCLAYDKHFKITFAEVKNFHEEYQINGNSSYPVPDIIRNWPANPQLGGGYETILAPFFDANGDGTYDIDNGDFPKYKVDDRIDACDKSILLGDQTIWWVFNDVGNIHNETNSQFPIGVEIQAQAFGFNTNDEINNMTFYRYKIINRASQTLNETYFGAWVDPDLGNYLDDYVGCDVARGLGYCYNGDAVDDGALGYGANPPAVGVDFFEGPLADAGDGIDNNRNDSIDEVGEQIIMSKFVYYNNDGSPTGNPVNAQQYYNYLKGIWKDGSPIVYGGTGYQTAGAPNADFMFPGDSDPDWIGTGGQAQPFLWTEACPVAGCGTPNEPSDRRFIQSAGKFTLQPGAINFITTGVVWARTSSGGPAASVKLLKLADVKAQNLFESCFRVINGPDAPAVQIRELDKEIILSISNPRNSNNYQELYKERDSNIPGNPNAFFNFEGYKIYQVKDQSVSVTELGDADRARLIFQCDIKNGIAQIVNQTFNGDLNAFIPTEEVLGEDNGLRHTFRITSDAFATGDPLLINHKTYYFMAIAYAYDSVASIFDPYDPPAGGLYGLPYIQSRKMANGDKISVFTAIPHISAPEANGLQLNSFYGDGPEITRVAGKGNGYNIGADRKTLDVKQEQINEIIFNQSQNRIAELTYQRARGPVDVRIYDPVKVTPNDYELYLDDTTTATGRWYLKNMQTGVISTSEKTLEFPYDQLFPEYGFYVSMNQVVDITSDQAGGNGFVEGTRVFSNPNNRWLSGIADRDNDRRFNWILSGSETTPIADIPDVDNSEFYEGVLGGTWAPFNLVNYKVSGDDIAPAPKAAGAGGAIPRQNQSLKWLNSVDVVLTNDKSKWSRCVVFETQTTASRAEGNQSAFYLRKHPSLNIDGTYSTTDSGMSWFPGYAIDLETGERLNIAFGEDSYINNNNYPGETGDDMKFNPTRSVFGADGKPIFGGKHFIYVFGNYAANNEDFPVGSPALSDTSYWGGAYDGCQHIYHNLWRVAPTPSSVPNRQVFAKVWKDAMWVSIPVVAAGQTLLDNDVRVRLRVSKPYRQYDAGISTPNNNLPYYKFNTYNLTAKVNQTDVAKNALSLINAVPNPYYAYSNYEANQLDNRIKITNLPPKCTVTIYTVSGTLIRQFNRDQGFDNTAGAVFGTEKNFDTTLDWDLKNSKGIPVASGMYLIHVKADGIGERTIKWFGVIRPIDLDTF